ncbi:methyl-accepting chemotaxis protein [Duffyella gerundensis]|uniref:methyl-accepting chemotaxis protein n=1 Tax=Duffyella TaxID=3026546 RepID=UPI003F6DF83F
MLKRIRIVTGLLGVLVLFAVIQLAMGGMFFHTVKADKDNFAFSQQMSNLQRAMGTSWVSLVQARNTLNRAGIQHLQDATSPESVAAVAKLVTLAKSELETADRSMAVFNATLSDEGRAAPDVQALLNDYKAYRQALDELTVFFTTNQFQAFIDQPTQGFQDRMGASYANWQKVINQLMADGVATNESAWQRTIWMLTLVLIVSLSVMLLVWSGMQKLLVAPLKSSIAHIRHIAAGDLTQKIEVESRNEIGELLASLQHMQQELISTVSRVRDGSDAIYTGASEIAAGNNDLSARTEQQAASLEETAASMEQLTATVKQNAENARQASQLALSASETAEKGGSVVAGVVKTMNEIAGSSKKIADIISVIDGIAFQTNILALNAAVEAARAGEQGRGFAVVAGEVRNLAQRSAQAAKEIKSLIQDSVNRVDSGSNQVSVAGATMNDIVNAVTRVTDIMGEIASASDEQSRGIDQIGIAVTEMDQVTQQNASLVQESAAAAASLEDQASRLKQAVSAFNIRKEFGGQAVNQVRESKNPLTVPVLAGGSKSAANANDNWETF